MFSAEADVPVKLIHRELMQNCGVLRSVGIRWTSDLSSRWKCLCREEQLALREVWGIFFPEQRVPALPPKSDRRRAKLL